MIRHIGVLVLFEIYSSFSYRQYQDFDEQLSVLKCLNTNDSLKIKICTTCLRRESKTCACENTNRIQHNSSDKHVL